MNIVKCERGHYYDADVFESCPHCIKEDNGQNGQSNTMEIITDYPVPKTEKNMDDRKTQGIWSGKNENMPASKENIDLVVGWLVCVDGMLRGKSFELYAKKNFIGRAEGDPYQKIVLPDPSVSRRRHGAVTYDPQSGNYIVMAGESRELVYKNDELVLSSDFLKPYDKLTIGKVNLIFIPFCGENYIWSEFREDQG